MTALVFTVPGKPVPRRSSACRGAAPRRGRRSSGGDVAAAAWAEGEAGRARAVTSTALGIAVAHAALRHARQLGWNRAFTLVLATQIAAMWAPMASQRYL